MFVIKNNFHITPFFKFSKFPVQKLSLNMKLFLFTSAQECVHMEVDAFYFNHINQSFLHHFCLKTCCPVAIAV